MTEEIGLAPDETGERRNSYAGDLLLAALRAPAPDWSATAERIGGGLVVLLAAEGATREMAAFLSVQPGQSATFEVYTFGPPPDGSTLLPLTSTLEGLDVAEALRRALQIAQTGAHAVTVVALDSSGIRRRVLEWSGSGSLRFVFPNEDSFEGDPEQRSAIVQRWQEFFEQREPASQPNSDSRSEAVAAAGMTAATLSEAVREALAELTVEVDLENLKATLGETISETLRECLGDTYREPAPGSEVPSAEEIGRVVSEVIVAALPAPAAVVVPSADEIADRVVASVRTALVFPAVPNADEVVERVLAMLPPPISVDEVADRVSAVIPPVPPPPELPAFPTAAQIADRVVAFIPPPPRPLVVPSAQEIAEAVTVAVAELLPEPPALPPAPVIPSAQEIAKAVSTFIPEPPPPAPPPVLPSAQELAEQLLTALWPLLADNLATIQRADAASNALAQAALIAAADQLNMQFEAFNDRIRSGTRSIQSLADELSARERSAASLTEQLAKSVQADIDRLVSHVDSKLDHAATERRERAPLGATHNVRGPG